MANTWFKKPISDLVADAQLHAENGLKKTPFLLPIYRQASIRFMQRPKTSMG